MRSSPGTDPGRALALFFKGHLDLRPLEATALGLKGHDGQLEDLSPRGIRRQSRFYGAWGRRLGRLRRGAPPALRADLERTEGLARFCLHLLEDRPEHPSSVDLVFDVFETLAMQAMQARTPAELSDLAARMNALPRFLRRLGANLERAPARLAPDRAALEDAVRSLPEMGRYLEEDLPRLAGGRGSASAKRLARAARPARLALVAFSATLRARLPRSRENWALGEREYRWRLRNGLGIPESPRELGRIGRRLLAGIRLRMVGVARRVSPGARGEGGMRRLASRMRRLAPRGDREMLAMYDRLSERARRFLIRKGLFRTCPPTRLRILPTPAGLGEALTTAAYFPAPPLDPGRKGVFLATPSRGVREKLKAHNPYHAASTAVHEAFPGHDMQFFLWQGMGQRVPPWRYLHGDPKDWSTSMNIEGYAHYAEELMRREGFFTPREELFQLAGQAWRAARIVVDSALHTGRMTVRQAAGFMEREGFLDPETARGEAFRYTKWPTQALTYALGRLEIERVKDRCRRGWGKGFTEARFHEAFLAFGPLPPAVIARELP